MALSYGRLLRLLRLVLPASGGDRRGVHLAGHAKASAGVLVAVALLSGAVIAPSTAAVRSVWSDLLAADAEARQAGYALIGMLQEVAFVDAQREARPALRRSIGSMPIGSAPRSTAR